MSTVVLANELGMTRPRHEASTSRRVSSPAVPHSQTWALSAEANKKSGTCSVCFATRQLHLKDGTVHKHGHRGNPCSGSHQPPLSDSVHSNPVTRLSNTATSISDYTVALGLATLHPDVSKVVGTASTPSSTSATVNMVTANTTTMDPPMTNTVMIIVALF